MQEHESFVDEIEVSFGKRICDDAVPAHLDVRSPQPLLQPSGVEIGGQHVSRLADARREPTGDRPTAGADLETGPSLAHAETVEMPERDGIEERRERAEPGLSLERRVVEEIAGVTQLLSPLTAAQRSAGSTPVRAGDGAAVVFAETDGPGPGGEYANIGGPWTGPRPTWRSSCETVGDVSLCRCRSIPTASGPKKAHHVSGTVNGMGVRAVVEPLGEGRGILLGPAWRRDCGIAPGDEVAVVLFPEGPQRDDLAPDVAAALASEPTAAEFFDSLAQFYRNAYLRWIDATKRRPEVRDARIGGSRRTVQGRNQATTRYMRAERRVSIC